MTARVPSSAVVADVLMAEHVVTVLLLQPPSGGADFRPQIEPNRGDAVVAWRRRTDRDDGRDHSWSVVVVPIRKWHRWMGRRGRGGSAGIHDWLLWKIMLQGSAVARCRRLAPLGAAVARGTGARLLLMLWVIGSSAVAC